MKNKAILINIMVICGLGLLMSNACGTAQSGKEQKETMENQTTYNNPEEIKELIIRMKSELETDNDWATDLIQEMEAKVSILPEGTDKAVLHSMLAEMYNQYLLQNRWVIDQRTAISRYTPDDIREWSTNLFEEKVKEHLTASLQPAGLLQSTPATTYEAIMEKGQSSSELRPALYDFLAGRATMIRPSKEIYDDWLAFRNSQENKKAALLVELASLEYSYTSDRSDTSLQTYQQALERLLQEYKDYDFSTDIRIALVNYSWHYAGHVAN